MPNAYDSVYKDLRSMEPMRNAYDSVYMKFMLQRDASSYIILLSVL